MSNILRELSETVRWHLLVNATKTALEAQGYSLDRVPGRGLSNIWNISKDGKTQVASIRTTRNRYIAFPPLENGSKFKTLDDVDLVAVATVDSKDEPEKLEIYLFPADEVRKRFKENYVARTKDGQSIKDNFGMWVALDAKGAGPASSIGTGIINKYKPIAVYSISNLLADNIPDATEDDELNEMNNVAERGFASIAEVMAWARENVAQLAGVQVEAVKLDLKIEY
jgi:hypothetical protein